MPSMPQTQISMSDDFISPHLLVFALRGPVAGAETDEDTDGQPPDGPD